MQIYKKRETKIKNIQEVIRENTSITTQTKYTEAQNLKPITKEQLTIASRLHHLHLNEENENIFEIDALSFNH